MIAQTTPTGRAIAQAIAQGYALEEIKHCALLRRGFNHVYGLECVDGRKAVARLSADRPRGAPNLEYEAAFLRHLKRADIAVAASIPTRDGSDAFKMDLPEGERSLMLFEHLDGEPMGDSLTDIEATGRGLALMHDAGETYRGPPSHYILDLPFLLDASIQRICAAPTTNDALRSDFLHIGRRLAARIAAIPTLTRVSCHGDCHGGNNFMTEDKTGTRIASFFDFDDAGPGWMSYDLSVYLWSMLPRQIGAQLDARALDRWRRYLKGYRSVRALDSNDFDAIAAFVAVRQCWFIGEHAGRVSVWGTQSIPQGYLRKQVELFSAWESLNTPD